MQQIIHFLIQRKTSLCFLLLLIIGLTLTINSHNYHSNKFIASTNAISGAVFETRNNITSYFKLKSFNERLLQENTLLKQKLTNQPSQVNTNFSKDTAVQFKFIPATVINSTYQKKSNYITLNKGSNDGVKPDMGVITDLGIVGIVKQVSANYALVISLLHANSTINAQLKKTNHFGSLVWDGKTPNLLQLTDIPRLAPLKQGDTIITGGRSTIFPKGIPIGTIKNYYLNSDKNYFTVNVTPFNDMTNIGFVQLIKNKDAEEILTLQKSADE